MLIIEIAVGIVLGVFILAYLPQILVGVFLLGIAVLIYVNDGEQTLEIVLCGSVAGYIGFKLLERLSQRPVRGKPRPQTPRVICVLCGKSQYSQASPFCTQCGSALQP